MDVFDIIGPVMVGPSSSHTAGAARMGRMARGILGEEPVEAVIKLHGSFAMTYKGHGTDKAIIGGLMGFATDDLRIRNSMEIAKQQGLQYKIETADLGDEHPNTANIELRGKSGQKVFVRGSSTGGGNIVINQVDGIEVELTGQYYTLIIPHKDAPGTVAAVTSILSEKNINIAQMKLYRSRRGGDAMMVLETDQPVDFEIAKLLGSLPSISDVKIIEPM